MDLSLDPLAKALDHADSLPFLFVGSGVSRRYLSHDNFHDLLGWAASLTDMPLPYYLAASSGDLPAAASSIAEAFYPTWWSETKYLPSRRKWGDRCTDKRSPLKFMVAKRLDGAKLVASKQLRAELKLLAKCQVDGIITTNYDTLLENTFEDFTVFVGQQDLLLSRSYQLGEIYKIHGSVIEPNGIVLCREDYERFADASAYLVAKLISVFVEHPVIFLGYSLSDPNIRVILASLMNCLGHERIHEFRERFIWVDYQDQIAQPVVDEHLIDLGEGRLLPVLRVRTASFAPVFELLAQLERAVPLGLLRKVAGTVVEIVRSTDPTRYLSVRELEDLSNISDKTLVVGVTDGSPSNHGGFRMLDRYDLIRDLVVDDPRLSDARAVVLELLPYLIRQHPTAWIPVFKYVRKSGLSEDELPESVRLAMHRTLRPLYPTVPPEVANTSNSELVEQHGIAKALNLLRSMTDADIDIGRLEQLIRDNIDSLSTTNSNVKTAFSQAAARLDRLWHESAPRPAATTVRIADSARSIDRKAVRDWAAANGHVLANRGPIPKELLHAYRQETDQP